MLLSTSSQKQLLCLFSFKDSVIAKIINGIVRAIYNFKTYGITLKSSISLC